MINKNTGRRYYFSTDMMVIPLSDLKTFKESKAIDKLVNFYNAYMNLNLPNNVFDRVMSDYLVKLAEEMSL